MSRVRFYILDEEPASERERFACRLAAQLYRQGRRVYLHAADEPAARALDDLLWTFRPRAFVPHGLLDREEQQVAIGWRGEPDGHREVMINLALEVPAFAGRFEQVAEIVVRSAEIRGPLREAYLHYRDGGHQVETSRL